MYKLRKDFITGEVNVVEQVETRSFIPFDPANSDYQRYLEWLAEGNTPEPADE